MSAVKEAMIQIELSGVLGKRFDKTHQRLINTIHEEGIALAVTIPGFEKLMINSREQGLTFAVFRGKNNIGEADLGFTITGEIIRIVPVVIGSKKAGILQTILGAVLAVAGAILWATPIGAPLVASGVGMILGDIVQMLSPQPAGLARRESPENKASYAFGVSPIPPHRVIRMAFFTANAGSVARLFLREFTSKIRCNISME
nr:MAG TPA_asm: tail assembly protein [Caudoviricetes sp.]